MPIPVVAAVAKRVHTAAHILGSASKNNLVNTASNLNKIISSVRTNTTDKTKTHEDHTNKLFQQWKIEKKPNHNKKRHLN